ncbi:hypothetical protein U9M48_028424 [Paspalum notatum var. saurae]|uniref:Uncharacterized protein n=1 Tax=Paspalum notatum var. saurae TaxID=547442 RepID=A0AAQ3X1E5_PASNO
MAVQISVLDEYGARWDITLSYALSLRHNYEAAISNAAQEALATLCYSCHSLLVDGTLRYLPRRQPGGLNTWIVTPTAEKNPCLEATVDYLVAFNTDYNALAEELCTAKLEISMLKLHQACHCSTPSTTHQGRGSATMTQQQGPTFGILRRVTIVIGSISIV